MFYLFLGVMLFADIITCDNNDSTCILEGGRKGECKSLDDCISAFEILHNKENNSSTCGFQNNQPLVCCSKDLDEDENDEDEDSTPLPDIIFPDKFAAVQHDNKIGKKSKKKCMEYGKHVFIKKRPPILIPNAESIIIDECGFNGIELIVGGVAAKPKEFPHMALIGYGDEPNKKDWRCGGSLISEMFVLTAGHCTKKDPKWVHLGLVNISRENETESLQIFSVSEIIRHPNYTGASKYHDIALIKLDKPVKFTAHVRPACLHDDDKVKENFVVATGWGSDGSENLVQNLMKVRLNLTAEEVCDRTYPQKKYLLSGIDPKTQFCAGDFGSVKDTCVGDSGGPVQIFRRNVKCMYDIVGITSFGLRCGAAPAVYTRTSSYISWIENVVWP